MIRKVKEPTDWVSSHVAVEKPNEKLRICIALVHLNQVLKQSLYPSPWIDVFPELADAKAFQADLKDAAFQTPRRSYCWKRMPFGISAAPELFRQKLDHNLEGLPGVHRIFDNLLMAGTGDTL